MIIAIINGEGGQWTKKMGWNDLLYLVAFSNAEILESNSEIFLPISTFDSIGSGNAPSDLGAGHS
jgi:hypothetical protein